MPNLLIVNNLPKGGDASRAGLPLQARSPDTSWVRLDRWQALTSEQRRKFLPLCPDFVIELRSETDSIKKLQDKMQEYLENGLRLG